MLSKESEIKDLLKDTLKRYFHVMSLQEIENSIRRYNSVKYKKMRARRMRLRDPPPTDYNETVIERFGSRQKAIKSVTKEIQKKVKESFGITSEKEIEGTNFLIDLFDVDERVCYEIALGDGNEIFKDILKAIMIGAKKLVIFSRSYPNPWGMTSYDYIKRQWEMMKDKIKLNVEIIEPISEKIYR